MTEEAFYGEVLSGEECQCGRVKRSGLALCFRCWRELPEGMRADLAGKGGGFPEAYERAVSWLEDA